jgi:hypothetical protein
MPRFWRWRRRALEVDQLEERIGRRLDPDQPGVRPDLRFDRIRVGEIEIADLDSHRALAHPLEQTARAAVEVVDRDDMGTLVEAFERRRNRREAGRKSERDAAAFEIGDAAL